MKFLSKCLVVACALGLTLAFASRASAKEQWEKCLDKVYNTARKVYDQEQKNNRKLCIKEQTGSQQACVDNEHAKAEEQEGKLEDLFLADGKCDPVPAYGVNSSTGTDIGDAAQAAADAIAYGIFGGTVSGLDGINNPPAKCQDKLIQRPGRAGTNQWKAMRKCAKDSHGSIGDIEACIVSGLGDAKATAEFDKLQDDIGKQCDAKGMTYPLAGTEDGACAAATTPAEMRTCIEQETTCANCMEMQDMTGGDVDCDTISGLVGCSDDYLLAEADIIIQDGRVIDPETGRDEIATVGVEDGKITVITTDSKPTFATSEFRRVIDASNLVVSPGFINTHTHEGIWNESMKAYVSDGITTWIGGNCGFSGTAEESGSTETVVQFMETLEAAGMYNNYAALTGHISLRRAVGVEQFGSSSQEQVDQMVTLLQNDLDAGGWGVSFGAFYDPGCETATMIRLAQASKDKGGMAASHIRYNLMRAGQTVIFANVLEEAIDTCRQTGVPFIVSHLTDVTYNNTTEYALDKILQAADTEGLPIAADIIGYNSFSNDFFTILGYGAVPVEMGIAWTGLAISDFQVLEDVYIDGELYMNQYDYFQSIQQAQTLSDAIKEGRAESPRVWCYIVKPENTKTALKRSYVFMGNDGAVRRNSETGELDGEPRTVACFSRLFGHWVREEGAITFMQAMYKATLAPALWLGLEKKGRLQVGCDADITLFDPDTIIDRSSPIPDEHLLPPDGIPYVIVNGALVVDQGVLTGNKPGQVLRRNWTIPGDTQGVIEMGSPSAAFLDVTSAILD